MKFKLNCCQFQLNVNPSSDVLSATVTLLLSLSASCNLKSFHHFLAIWCLCSV